MENQDFLNYLLLALLFVLLLTIVIIVAMEYMRKKVMKERMMTAELKLKHQTELLHTVIRSQEEERKRVSDALHDDIGSKLTAIKLGLYQLGGHKEELVSGLQELAEKVVQRTREISHAYSPVVVEKFGLEAGLQELLDDMLNGTDVAGSLDIDIAEGYLQEEERLLLFRISQELINNTLKHAQADNLQIRIMISQKDWLYEYEDDGKGFDQKKSGAGIGMLNIHNRADMMGAVLAWETSPGKGMKISITK